MRKQDIQTVLDVMHQQHPTFGIGVVNYNKAIAILTATLAEPSEATAWLSEDAIGERYLSFDKPIDDYPMWPLVTHPAPSKPEPSEADKLLMNLGLNPVQYRTEGGVINHLKVKAAILHPQDYPQYVKGALVIPGYESGPMVDDKP